MYTVKLIYEVKKLHKYVLCCSISHKDLFEVKYIQRQMHKII